VNVAVLDTTEKHSPQIPPDHRGLALPPPAQLLRGGRVYATGTVAHLLSSRSLEPGVYTMQVRTGTHEVTRFKIRLG
jgi:hypothetical protein